MRVSEFKQTYPHHDALGYIINDNDKTDPIVDWYYAADMNDFHVLAYKKMIDSKEIYGVMLPIMNLTEASDRPELRLLKELRGGPDGPLFKDVNIGNYDNPNNYNNDNLRYYVNSRLYFNSIRSNQVFLINTGVLQTTINYNLIQDLLSLEDLRSCEPVHISDSFNSNSLITCKQCDNSIPVYYKVYMNIFQLYDQYCTMEFYNVPILITPDTQESTPMLGMDILHYLNIDINSEYHTYNLYPNSAYWQQKKQYILGDS